MGRRFPCHGVKVVLAWGGGRGMPPEVPWVQRQGMPLRRPMNYSNGTPSSSRLSRKDTASASLMPST